MHGDIRDDWKLNEIDNKAQRAMDKANEIDSVRSNVDSLEHLCRELSTQVDGLRHELQSLKDGLRQVTEY